MSLFLLAIAEGVAFADQAASRLGKAFDLALNGQTAAVDTLAKKAVGNEADWLEIRATAHFYAGDGAARSLAAAAAKSAPRNAHISETEILYCTNNRGQASEHLDRARRLVKENPDDGRALAALAICCQFVGGGDASALFDKAVSLSPADFDVNYFAAKYFWHTTQPAKASAAFDRLVKSHPDSAQAYRIRGEYRRDQFDLKNATADLQKVSELNPAIAPGAHLAKSLRKSGNYEEAAREFTKIIEKEHNGNAYGRRAECYKKLNRLQDALKDYDEALKYYSPVHNERVLDTQALDKMPITRRLAYEKYWLYRIELKDELGKLKEGIDEATQFLKVRPNSESALDLRQKLLYKTGDWRGALRDLSRLITINKFDEAYYLQRASVYEKLGNRAEAAADRKHADNLSKTGEPG
ncbi:MAG TPA: tetratricopeptide repeat protein [Chroococcales cyanobacterium]